MSKLIAVDKNFVKKENDSKNFDKKYGFDYYLLKIYTSLCAYRKKTDDLYRGLLIDKKI